MTRPASAGASARADAARVFLALPVPEAAHAGIRFAVSACKGRLPRLRWEPSAKWHLTLRFIAALRRERLVALSALARQAASRCAPLELSADALIGMPYRRGGAAGALALRIVDNPALDALKQDLEDALERAGMPDLEARGWLPHITMARTRGRRPAPLPETAERCHCRIPANELALVESALSPKGARHCVLERWPLGA